MAEYIGSLVVSLNRVGSGQGARASLVQETDHSSSSESERLIAYL